MGISSLPYMPMHAMLKRKIYKEKKNKSKKKQNASKIVARVYLGDVRVIG